MAYQSFDDEKGDSQSAQKLQCIKLPEDLSGLSVLDIGCNEGYFCREAIRRGASRVVGIDMNDGLIQKARERVPQAQFETKSWWDLDETKFDIILFLSAIHYEGEQKRLLSFLRQRLKEGGVLILEGGVDMDWGKKDWKWVRRHDAPMRFPTISLLVDDLLEGYSVRTVGPSVPQKGDPQSRHVLHCTHQKPTLFFVLGESRSGKTNFARLFAKQGIRTLHLDPMIGMLAGLPEYGRTNFLDYLKQTMASVNYDVWQLTRKIEQDRKEEDMARLIMSLASKDDPITVVEGYILNAEGLMSHLRELAVAEGYEVTETHLGNLGEGL
jgi:SAM-dependent methyltransferase